MSNVIPLNYDGLSIRFNDEGWINATDVAEKFNKEPTAWLRQIDALEYMSALSKKLFGKSGFLTEINEIRELDTSSASARAKVLRLVKSSGLVSTKTGPQGGTWIHPKLAIRFARWLSVDFEIWCDEQIDLIIRGQVISYTDKQIIELLTHQEATTWEKRFKAPFYSALSKLTRLPYNGHIGGCPALFGKITADWVYGVALPDVVYDSVKGKTNGREKIHQFLKPELLAAVEYQLMSVTALASGCVDYKDFEARCTAAYGVKGQLKLIYPSSAA